MGLLGGEVGLEKQQTPPPQKKKNYNIIFGFKSLSSFQKSSKNPIQDNDLPPFI